MYCSWALLYKEQCIFVCRLRQNVESVTLCEGQSLDVWDNAAEGDIFVIL